MGKNIYIYILYFPTQNEQHQKLDHYIEDYELLAFTIKTLSEWGKMGHF